MRLSVAFAVSLPVLSVVTVVGMTPLMSSCRCQGAACNQPDGSLPPGSCEPDGSYSIDTAVAVTPGTPVTETICPILDDDYWKFSTGTSPIAEITLTRDATLSGIDLALTVLNSAASSVGTVVDSDGSDGATNLRLVLALDANAEYTIKVSDVGGDDSDPTNRYSLDVKLSAQPDTNEPNDDNATATAANTTAAGNDGWLATSGDVDVFSIEATAGSIMRFELTVPEASLISPIATMTNGDGETIFTSPTLPATGTRVTSANVALRGSGPYRITLADPAGAADFRTVEGRYHLKSEVLTDPDTDEASGNRNDSLLVPTQVDNPTAMVTRRPSLSSIGDEDHYMVVIDAAAAANNRKLLEVRLTLPAGTPREDFRPVLSVWDQVMWIEGESSANCSTRTAENGGFLCRKPCTTGSLCGGEHGGDQQECIPADPDAPTVDRYCAEPRILKRLTPLSDGSVTTSLRYPLRSGRNPVVKVADELSDSFDERQFTLTMQIVDDPDTHEPDDLPAPLLAIGGSGSGSARDQDLRFFPHAAIGPGNIPALCPLTVDAGVVTGCLNRLADGNPTLRQQVDCSGYDETTMEVTGYLSHEGDRDYYRFDVPEGFYNLDVEYEYDPSGVTPVEFAVFVYVANEDGLQGEQPLRGSFILTEQLESTGTDRLMCQFDTDCPDGQDCTVQDGNGICRKNTGEATQSTCATDGDCNSDERCRPNGSTGRCRGDCVSHLECPDNALCIERKCFADTDDNMGTTGTANFGPASGECLYAHQCNDRPLYVEVADNGLNDSDRTTPYTLRVRIRCGCPGVCGMYCSPPMISCERGN